MKKNEDVVAFYVDYFDKAIQEEKVVVIIPRSHENAEPRIGLIKSVHTTTEFEEEYANIVFHLAIQGEKGMEALIPFYYRIDEIFTYPDFKSAKKEHFVSLFKEIFKKGLGGDTEEITNLLEDIKDEEE